MTNVERAIDEFGASWRQSPFSVIFAVVMLVTIGGAGLIFWSVLSWTQETLEVNDLRHTESIAEIEQLVSHIDETISEFEGRQKLFRDQVRAEIASGDVEIEERTAELWEGLNAQFKVLENQNAQHLMQIEEIKEMIAQPSVQ